MRCFPSVDDNITRNLCYDIEYDDNEEKDYKDDDQENVEEEDEEEAVPKCARCNGNIFDCHRCSKNL